MTIEEMNKRLDEISKELLEIQLEALDNRMCVNVNITTRTTESFGEVSTFGFEITPG